MPRQISAYLPRMMAWDQERNADLSDDELNEIIEHAVSWVASRTTGLKPHEVGRFALRLLKEDPMCPHLQ
ncbi:MAG: hypothetical protein WD273_09065 [Trueperaceae bacterium]